MFRGAELMRLIAGVFLLAILFVFISNQRNAEPPAKNTKPAADAKEAPPKEIPPATGPTDEDPEEVDAAREEFQALTDGAMNLGPEEMEAYDRLVRWANNQPFARLEARAKKGLRYTDLYDDPAKHRGALVALDVDVRMAGDAGKTRDDIPLHDAWAVTNESRGRLYSLIVVDYPKNMPTGFNIRAKARFAGYFLKLQGYEPGSAKPGQKPEKAPLLIGRLEWIPPTEAGPASDGRQEWIWGLGLVAIFVVLGGAHFIYRRWIRRPVEPRLLKRTPVTNDAVPIEQWLDQQTDPNKNQPP